MNHGIQPYPNQRILHSWLLCLLGVRKMAQAHLESGNPAGAIGLDKKSSVSFHLDEPSLHLMLISGSRLQLIAKFLCPLSQQALAFPRGRLVQSSNDCLLCLCSQILPFLEEIQIILNWQEFNRINNEIYFSRNILRGFAEFKQGQWIVLAPPKIEYTNAISLTVTGCIK